MVTLIGLLCGLFAVGFWLGLTKRDKQMDAMYSAQEARRNHWFDRYMAVRGILAEHKEKRDQVTDDLAVELEKANLADWKSSDS